MSQETTTICDGRDCDKSAQTWERAAWIKVSQFGKPEGDDPKLLEELHFCSIDCAWDWLKAARDEYPKLQKAARGIYPRSFFVSQNVKGLAV